MIIYEWDYIANELITWKRTGECSMCGECCKNRVLFSTAGVKPSGNKGRDGGNTTSGERRWHEIELPDREERRFYRITHIEPNDAECQFFDHVTKQCLDQNGKPNICKDWPFNADKAAEFFPSCTYKFEVIKTEEMPE